MRFLVVLVLILIGTGCSIIGPGERGIRVSLGKASTDVKEPGAYFWFPVLAGMKTINIQLQKSEVEASAASKDMQEIKTHVAVNWSITPNKVVDTYKNIGDEDDVLARVITPAVNEAFKAALSKKTAEEVLAKRMELKKEIDDTLKERLSAYGVTLTDVSIVNLTFSKEFTEAIEKKQIAEQQAKQSEYVAQQAIQEAKAEVNRARGQSEAQKLLKATITKEILQQRAIEKWDGKFPQIIGSGALPFVDFKLEGR
jgi:prohibitin 1